MKFHLGLGRYFSPLEHKNRIVIRKAIEAGFGVHYCLDYIGSSRFFRMNTSRSERSRIEVIARVPGFDPKITVSEVEMTLRKLDIEKIEVLQIWGGREVYDMYLEGTPLLTTLERLRCEGKIGSFIPQLYYDQTVEVQRKQLPVRSFAFYGSPLALHIDEGLLGAKLQDAVCMSCFGGVEQGNAPRFGSESAASLWETLVAERHWNAFCLAYVESLGFVSRAVGTTGSAEHMDEIIKYFLSPTPLDQIQALEIQRVALDSCRRDHVAPTEAAQRWHREQRNFRAASTEFRHLAHSILKNHPRLMKMKNAVRSKVS